MADDLADPARPAGDPARPRRAADRDDAIRRCGAALVEIGAVDPAYVDTMLEREHSISTYVGEGVAIPHGTLAGKDAVHRDALAVLRFPDGVDWGGEPVSVCVGIAAQGDGHIGDPGRARRHPARPGPGPGAARGDRPRRGAASCCAPHEEDEQRSEGRPVPRPGRRPDRGRARAHGRARRGQAPGPQLLHLRHRREDLQVRSPPHHAAAGDGPRDRRRGGRGRGRGRRLGRRRPGAGDRGDPLRHVRRVPARPDDGLPEPGVDGLPLRRRVRRVS